MLVLTRKRSETIQIGENIFVKVIRTGRSTVKIGVEAPGNVRVVRGELLVDPTKLLPQAKMMYEHAEVVTACSDQFPHIA